MTDAEYAAEQARILRLIEYWRPRLHQSSWRLQIEWSREEKTSPAHEEGWINVIRFEVRADWKYAKARIYAYCGSTAPLSDEEIEESVVHELCHCLVHELQDIEGISNEYHAHEEHVVTILARAFIETRNRALDGDTDTRQRDAAVEVQHGNDQSCAEANEAERDQRAAASAGDLCQRPREQEGGRPGENVAAQRDAEAQVTR